MFELYAKVITFSSKFYFKDYVKLIKYNFDRNNLISLNKSLFLTTIFWYSKDISIRINIKSKELLFEWVSYKFEIQSGF